MEWYGLVDWEIHNVVDEIAGLVGVVVNQGGKVVQVGVPLLRLDDVQLRGAPVGINAHCIQNLNNSVWVLLQKVSMTFQNYKYKYQ